MPEQKFLYSNEDEVQPEPADLSTNKKKSSCDIQPDDNMDARSVSSTSTDPDRLEVDMSHVSNTVSPFILIHFELTKQYYCLYVFDRL